MRFREAMRGLQSFGKLWVAPIFTKPIGFESVVLCMRTCCEF